MSLKTLNFKAFSLNFNVFKISCELFCGYSFEFSISEISCNFELCQSQKRFDQTIFMSVNSPSHLKNSTKFDCNALAKYSREKRQIDL